jgi:hypothetical protein
MKPKVFRAAFDTNNLFRAIRTGNLDHKIIQRCVHNGAEAAGEGGPDVLLK